MDPQKHPVLSGWKEIANYLGKGVRTVQRYERELGLPIRRPAGMVAGSVIATTEELNAWVHARPLMPRFPLRHVAPNVSAFESFKKAIAEQRRLQDELKDTRDHLHASAEMIRASIAALHKHAEQETTQNRDRILFDISGASRKIN